MTALGPLPPSKTNTRRFDDIWLLCFVVSIGSFNENSDDGNVNSLVEAMKVFEECMGSFLDELFDQKARIMRNRADNAYKQLLNLKHTLKQMGQMVCMR